MSHMPTDADFQRIKELIFAGNKLGAIKAYRTTMGAELAEAKTEVEILTAELLASSPERFRDGPARGRSFAAALVALAGIGGVAWLLLR